MKKCSCLICSFENPHPTATAIIIRDGQLLVAKRNESPFKGQWDFIGGYMKKNETPSQTLAREIKEELGVSSSQTFLGTVTGTTTYGGFTYPILSFVFLTELKSEKIKLNAENSKLVWVPIKKLKKIAFDSNQKILDRVKKELCFDLPAMKKLVQQLDPRAKFSEQALYQAALTGHVETIERGGKLIAMGWIFPRQTALRRQAVIEDMIVDEAYRGKGQGEKILRALIAWARKNNIEVIELTTNPARVAANNLYKKVGFKLHTTNHYLLNL